jgi:hypothetical protein
LIKQIRLVVTVKSYPQPSSRYHESVCVAGIRTDTSDPEWVRLYPVQFRDLPEEKQFPKWSEIELDVSDSSSDNRLESLRPIESSIEVVRKIGTSANWAERMQLLEPLLVGSMCDVVRQQQATGASLAAFRPHSVSSVEVKAERSPDWSESDRNALAQCNLWAQDKRILEKIPLRWSYRYSCGPDCSGHRQKIIDWEIGEAWRQWRRRYGPTKTADLVGEHWMTLASAPKDPVFLVGNLRRWTNVFLVLGVCYPRKDPLRDLDGLQGRLDFASHLGDDLTVTRHGESLDT